MERFTGGCVRLAGGGVRRVFAAGFVEGALLLVGATHLVEPAFALASQRATGALERVCTIDRVGAFVRLFVDCRTRDCVGTRRAGVRPAIVVCRLSSGLLWCSRAGG